MGTKRKASKEYDRGRRGRPTESTLPEGSLGHGEHTTESSVSSAAAIVESLPAHSMPITDDPFTTSADYANEAPVDVESEKTGLDGEAPWVDPLSLIPRDQALPSRNVLPLAGTDDGAESDTGAESSISIAASDRSDPPDLDNMPLAIQKRLLSMRKEADSQRGTYYITKLPADLEFGRMDSFLDMRNFLVGRRNSPVKVFLSGILMSTDFRNGEGTPLRRVSVVVKPLTLIDSAAASRIYNEYSVPLEHIGTTKDSFLNIQAGRWQTSYGALRESPVRFSVFAPGHAYTS
ncbi:hypothetical protein CALVIDRAFT_528520 [Calocera viscosa TUFC12733]|uniref:Uncharacterized protein n=1 Tax=Calocera viscosa (strain TUFC12733) TaxID=1330018 RepID=A0A167KQ98_CALVF|nr:hypothetical protein CALVIDRAFT_528520 [Calocera viscosa TUFC12733]